MTMFFMFWFGEGVRCQFLAGMPGFLMSHPTRGVICPLGGIFTTLFIPRGEHSLLFRILEGRTDDFNPR
jgi:hypothetical protein